ncbi:MAG: penicillin-binding protein activator LpoB [Bacteriovoracia bacterium]
MRSKSAKLSLVLAVTTLLSFATACGPKAFTKGEYDDPTRVELLDDRFNEADMQQMADTIVKAMVACGYIANAKTPPIVIVERVQNRTEEHIDTVSMTDKIRTALIKTNKVRFVNKQQRETLEDEYKYNEGGNVSEVSQKKRGRQIGADYIFEGALATNIQEVGGDKLIYYKLTMNLTNLETSTIDCTEEREIRKKFKKQHVGL